MHSDESHHDVPLADDQEKKSIDKSSSTGNEAGALEDGRHEDSDAPASPRSISGVRWVMAVVAVISSILLYGMDNTIVATIQPPIISTLGHQDLLPWVSVGYMIGGLVTAMPSGKLYGLFNAKSLYIICAVLFAIGSALCGAAPNMAALIVGRVLAGIGGNGMYVGVLTLLSVNTTDKERPPYLSLIGLTYGIGCIIGPVIGGAFATEASWRWGFYINLCILAVFAPVYVFILPGFQPRSDLSLKDKIKTYDNVGTVLSVAGLFCGVMAINFGGTLYAWGSGQIIALFVVSGVLLALFSVQQSLKIWTSFEGRILPVQLIALKEPVLLFILMASNNCVSMVTLYYIPLYFQFIHGSGALNSGVRLLPFIVLCTVLIISQGALLPKYPLYKPWYVFGGCCVLVAAVMFSRVRLDTSNAYLYGFEAFMGLGIGCYLQAGYAVIQGVLDPGNMAFGVTFMLLAQLLGITVGLSVGGAVFINSALTRLRPLLPGVETHEIQSALSGLSGTFIDNLSSNLRQEVLTVILQSINKAFILAITAGATSVVASLLLANQKLRT